MPLARTRPAYRTSPGRDDNSYADDRSRHCQRKPSVCGLANHVCHIVPHPLARKQRRRVPRRNSAPAARRREATSSRDTICGSRGPRNGKRLLFMHLGAGACSRGYSVKRTSQFLGSHSPAALPCDAEIANGGLWSAPSCGSGRALGTGAPRASEGGGGPARVPTRHRTAPSSPHSPPRTRQNSFLSEFTQLIQSYVRHRGIDEDCGNHLPSHPLNLRALNRVQQRGPAYFGAALPERQEKPRPYPSPSPEGGASNLPQLKLQAARTTRPPALAACRHCRASDRASSRRRARRPTSRKPQLACSRTEASSAPPITPII